MAGTETGGRRRRSSSKKKGGENKKNDQVVKKGQGKGKGRGGAAKHEAPASKKNQRRLSGGAKGKKGKDNRRNSKGGAKAKPKPEKKEPLTAEQLDASMDDYWQKSKDKTFYSLL